MNRFSNDMGITDEIIPIAMLDAIQLNLITIGSIAVAIFADVRLAVPLLFLSVLFLVARKIYLKCSTNTKRTEKIST